jgi:hypothetical protein
MVVPPAETTHGEALGQYTPGKLPDAAKMTMGKEFWKQKIPPQFRGGAK